MAFPTIGAVGYSEEGSGSTSHVTSGITAAAPAGGELLVLFMVFDGEPTLSNMAAGWVQELRELNGTAVTVEVWTKEAVGGEEDFTFNTSASEHSNVRFFEIPAGEWESLEFAAAATGNSTEPAPPDLSPSWGSDDNLFLALYGKDLGNVTTGFPANYPDNQFHENTGGGSSVQMAMCSRELASGSETDTGTFTASGSAPWVALRGAVQPAAGGADDVFFENRHAIEQGMKPHTAAGLGGVLIE